MFKINRKINITILIAFISIVFFIFLKGNDRAKHLVTFPSDKILAKALIGEEKIEIEIVQTPEKKSKGLSGRKYLAFDKGMLFLYLIPKRYKFWMKDMLFPIDILWIKNGKIVEIDEDIPCFSDMPLSELPIYKPDKPVTAVLEVNAGFVDRNNIKVGDKLQILDF